MVNVVQTPRPSPCPGAGPRCRVLILTLTSLLGFHAPAATLTVQPAGNEGFDVFADGVRVAPIRLAVNGAIVADRVVAQDGAIQLSGLRTRDPFAARFGTNDFVRVTLPGLDETNGRPVVEFQLTFQTFNTNRWLAQFASGPAPFHFLVCALPTAQVWHQRGWLNATPYADPFPLLQDVHVGSPELSCLWNRNWSYLCPLGAHPIPMIGLWDPEARLYVGYDFQEARATDQSERYVATAYCWRQEALTNFIALAYPHGGTRYGNQVYPQAGAVLASRFHLEIDTDLPDTEDPNERFQARLFTRYTNSLPRVPAMNDLGWIPGQKHLSAFSGPISLNLYGTGSETTFYPTGTVLLYGWRGQVEMPIDTAVHKNDTASINLARGQIESLLTNYAVAFIAGGDPCLYWTKPLAGAWKTNWGGAPVTTLHNTEGWYAARVLVELYRYDRGRGQAKPEYLAAIDRLFNWARHFVWTRNEFADVPSSPFAIGGTLSTAFLLDYAFTFESDAERATNAALALQLANRITWRYLQFWAMDSDRFDGALDSAFLLEPNSGRDWAGLACANEVAWNIDSLTQVYVHTGDPRMRYYLRGLLQRWPALYQPTARNSIAEYGGADFTEGLGLFEGAGPGRGGRYPYGSASSLPLNEPVSNSVVRIVAGRRACIAFDRFDQSTDATDYCTSSNGACAFRLVSSLTGPFDVSFSYPFVNISAQSIKRVRNGTTNLLMTGVTRPTQSPSSLYLSQMQNGDVVLIGVLPPNATPLPPDASLVYSETNVVPFTDGAFTTVPLAGDAPLRQDWNDGHSFAGLIPGLRWTYGVPYEQGLRAATNPVAVTAPGASVVLVAYAPPELQALTQAPALQLEDGSTLPLSGHPVPGWRGWPVLFRQLVALDYAVLPPGHSLAGVDPKSTLVMSLTAFHGDAAGWEPVERVLTNASAAFIEDQRQMLALLALKSSFAQLPAGKIALLPLNTSGAAADFAATTGLDQKWVAITERQLIDTNQFNAARYPLAFHLAGENYVKTVLATNDGKAALTQYLAGGGTLVVLASGPYPFFYGYGPNDAPGPSDPLLPALGVPLRIKFEQAPAGIYLQRDTRQTILQSVPVDFPFPPGDQRLRSIDAAAVSASHRYVPLIRAVDNRGTNYGDAGAFLAFGSGPAAGGKLVYLWSTLLSGPQGPWVMRDVVSWIVNATLRPPPPRIEGAQLAGNQAVFHFNAQSNLEYRVQSRDAVATGDWLELQNLLSAPTNRYVGFTNTTAGSTSRFYRLHVGP